MNKNGSFTWDVTQRSQLALYDDSDTAEGGVFNNTNPNTDDSEFYAYDNSALQYGIAQDTVSNFMQINDFILEKKAFTYQVQVSFDGTNWIDGPSLPVGQVIEVKYKATGGNATSDLTPLGNIVTAGTLQPIISPSDVQNIVGSTNFVIEANANQ